MGLFGVFFMTEITVIEIFSCSSLLRSTSFPTRPFDFFPPSSPCDGECAVVSQQVLPEDFAYGTRMVLKL